MDKKVKLMLGDNMESLKKLPDNSVDSIVTDAPYGLGKEQDMNVVLKDWLERGYSEIEGKGFMGKEWDAFVPQPAFWKEAMRALKPGGHVLCFFGSRTYDLGVMAIRLGGFEIRDCITYHYGSGFPKSHNVGKAVDRLQGNEREIVGEKTGGAYSSNNNIGINRASLLGSGDGRKTPPKRGEDFAKITKGQSEWEGWGSALKPASEYIVLARKPLSEKSIAENVLKWRTGGLNIDGCRVGSEVRNNGSSLRDIRGGGLDAQISSKRERLEREDSIVEGRFPANLILECICDDVIKGERGERYTTSYIKKENVTGDNRSTKSGYELRGVQYKGDKGDIHTNPNCPCYMMDHQSGTSIAQQMNLKNGEKQTENIITNTTENIKNGSSRFFYNAKVSKAERNMGLDEFEDKTSQLNSGGIGRKTSVEKRLDNNGENAPTTKNTHPTVKGVNLMSYLCRLVTPPNGIVLDPFMGSGSTGIAARLEDFKFIGMEMDPEYFKIAEARIESYEKYRKFLK